MNRVLHAVRPVQSRLTEDLFDSAQRGQAALMSLLVGRLPYANADQIGEDIDRDYRAFLTTIGHDRTENDALVQAGLGLYLFCHYAERWGSSRCFEDRARADELLQDAHVLGLLYDLYDVDATYRDDRAGLHDVGTTSFILRLPGKCVALKIIKPWYLDDEFIAEQTSRYLTRYGILNRVIPDNFAEIYHSNERCVVMEFIDGITLRTLFQSEHFEIVDDPAAPSETSLPAVVRKLCSILERCASGEAPVHHGDLSTTNVLIEPSTGRLSLIDFGTNYLLTRPVGSVEQRDTLSFLMNRGQSPTEAGDIEGIALIIAEGVLRDDFESASADDIIDSVYLRFITVGRFLDDLLARAAGSSARGVDFAPGSFREIGRRAQSEFTELSARLHAARRRDYGVLDTVSAALSPINASQAVALVKGTLGRKRRALSESAEVVPEVRNLTWIPVLINACVLVVFISILIAHAGTSVWPDIIGWTVSLTYSIIAARYCVFVFADLRLTELPGPVRYAVPLCCLLIWPAILTPILIDWELWPICVAIGTAIIAANNEICVRSCATMQKAIQASNMNVSRLMANASKYLTGWRDLMVLFSASIFVLTALIWTGIAHDVLFYGLIVATAPAGKMYIQQTGQEAPLVHAGLHRMAGVYAHAKANCAASDSMS